MAVSITGWIFITQRLAAHVGVVADRCPITGVITNLSRIAIGDGALGKPLSRDTDPSIIALQCPIE